MDALKPEDLEKNFELMADWYRAVLFDNNGKVIAKKNSNKVDEKELRYVVIFIK
jgi:hypothetical protein